MKYNNKDTRTMSVSSLWCLCCKKVRNIFQVMKDISHLFSSFTVNLEQLVAC